MLPEEDYEVLRRRFEHVPLVVDAILHRSDSAIRHIYFPLSGVVALTASLESGASACIGLVGREGFLGLPVFLGAGKTTYEAIVQTPGDAVRVPAAAAGDLLHRAAVANVLHVYTQARLVETSQSAVCNRFHGLSERLARWLLSVHDRVSDDDLPLTQEAIAAMVGSRRAGVTMALGSLQESGVIHLSRGRVRVLDRARLEASACECHDVVRRAFAALFELAESRHLREPSSATDSIVDILRDINSRLIIAAIREQEARDQADARSRDAERRLNELLERG
jgi:CRP-like cAMP-binding protein